MSVLFLYSELSGHSNALIRRIADTSGSPVDVVYWDHKTENSSAHRAVGGTRVRFHPRSTLNLASLVATIRHLSPRVVYVSGWMDRSYLEAIRLCRFTHQMKFVTIGGIDDKWKGSLRQHVGALYFRARLRRLIDYFWVAGPEQYHYARHFGYRQESILPYLLSADTTQFFPTAQFTRRFVYVGRLDPRKGVDILIEAYGRLPPAVRADWPLVVIGSGELAPNCQAAAELNVRHIPFLQPDALVEELAAGGVACFPSRNDQWGVSIQELALMGYPLVASNEYGAAIQFLIPEFNGFSYPALDINALCRALQRMVELPEAEIERMRGRSAQLGRSIQLDFSVASFLSVARPENWGPDVG